MPPLEAATPAHRGDDAGRQRNATLGSSQISDTAKNPALQPPSSAVRAAIADLHRDFVAERLRIAAIKAAHGADNILLGDDLNAERDIRISFENIREASKAFHEWQALNETMAERAISDLVHHGAWGKALAHERSNKTMLDRTAASFAATGGGP